MYLNYSIQAAVTNPELVVVVQHERTIKKLGDKEPVLIEKELFIAALNHIPDKFVQLEPMNLNLPLDVRDLKNMLPKSLSKSELQEQEYKIRQDVRQEAAFGGNKSTVLVILLVVSVIIGIVSLLHDYKVF